MSVSAKIGFKYTVSESASGTSELVEEGTLRTVGERLAWLRRRTGMNLMDAASAAGISKTEISRLERDERRVTLSHLRKLAPIYDVSVAEIAHLLEFETLPISTARLAEDHAVPRTEQRTIPLFDAFTVSSVGMTTDQLGDVTVPAAFEVSQSAYAIRFEAGNSVPWVPPGGIALVDPAQTLRQCDLVINAKTWSPLIIGMAQAEDARILGNEGLNAGSLSDSALYYHRILALVFRPADLGLHVRRKSISGL